MIGVFLVRSTVAALLLLVMTPAIGAENVTLRDVVFDVGDATYRIKTIDILDSTVGQPVWSALFDRNNPRPVIERFALPDAGRVTIPEIVIENPRIGNKFTLRDLVLSTIAGGRIGTLTVAGASATGPTADSAAFGPLSAADLDLALAARLFDGAVAASGEPGRVVSSLTLDAIDVKSPDTTFRIDRIAANDLRAKAGLFNDTPKADSLMGSVTISGVAAEMPDSSAPGARLKWRIGGLAFAADEPRNGVSTRSRVSLQGFSMDLDGQSAMNRDLREWGYDRLELSAIADANWDERAAEFVVRNVALELAGAGSVSLRGKLGNVTRDVFANPAAAERTSLKSFEVRIEDKGLFERIVARDARRDGRSVDAVRADYARNLGFASEEMLGDSPNGKLVADAVVAFAKKPGTLEIVGSARDPAGILLSDMGASMTPGPILDRFDLKAVAK